MTRDDMEELTELDSAEGTIASFNDENILDQEGPLCKKMKMKKKPGPAKKGDASIAMQTVDEDFMQQ